MNFSFTVTSFIFRTSFWKKVISNTEGWNISFMHCNFVLWIQLFSYKKYLWSFPHTSYNHLPIFTLYTCLFPLHQLSIRNKQLCLEASFLNFNQVDGMRDNEDESGNELEDWAKAKRPHGVLSKFIATQGQHMIREDPLFSASICSLLPTWQWQNKLDSRKIIPTFYSIIWKVSIIQCFPVHNKKNVMHQLKLLLGLISYFEQWSAKTLSSDFPVHLIRDIHKFQFQMRHNLMIIIN